MKFVGPGRNFDLLFENSHAIGTGLPAELREIYRGDWVIPDTSSKPYSYSNFVISHDGKVSFNVPGHEGGGDVSDFNSHDQWIMALARARADAVVVGANTLRTEYNHEWTAEFIFPSEAKAFGQFRVLEKRTTSPIQVLVTNSGELRADAAILNSERFRVLIATTSQGADNVLKHKFSNVEVLDLGESEVDLSQLYRLLHSEFSCQTILCEGGPRLYASIVASGQLDEEFLTISPILVGNSGANPRPSLLEGHAFEPGTRKMVTLSSLRQSGNHLFLRSTWS